MKDFSLGSVVINNDLNPNTYHYAATHKKNITPGDLFEINVYENLLLWASEDDHISWVCSKNVKFKSERDGLGTNPSGQIVYYVDYLSFAEFDMLFYYNDTLINIEATTSLNQGALPNYFKKIKKNHYILNKAFSTSKIHTVFLLLQEPPSNLVFPENTSFAVVKSSFNKLDMSNGLPAKLIRPTHKLFKKDTKSISYTDLLSKFQKDIFSSFFFDSPEVLGHTMKENIFFERSFLGIVKSSKFDFDFLPPKIKFIYPCLNNDLSLSLFYVLDKQTYEVTYINGVIATDVKKKHFSRSRKMLFSLLNSKQLKFLSGKRIRSIQAFSSTNAFNYSPIKSV